MSRTMSSAGPEPTPEQWKYVDGLRRKLHLSEPLLNNHCVTRFKQPLSRLDRRQVSLLIDEMKEWAAIPGQLLREAGQRDLPGFEAS